MWRMLVGIALLSVLCVSLFTFVLALAWSHWLIALGAGLAFAGSLRLFCIASDRERRRQEAIRWEGYELKELVVKAVDGRARHEPIVPTPPLPSHYQRVEYGPFGSTHMSVDGYALSTAWQMYHFAMREAMEHPRFMVVGYDYLLTFEEYPEEPLKVFSTRAISTGERFNLRIKHDAETRKIVDYAFV